MSFRFHPRQLRRSALMIPANSMAEFEDQVEWFAKTVL